MNSTKVPEGVAVSVWVFGGGHDSLLGEKLLRWFPTHTCVWPAVKTAFHLEPDEEMPPDAIVVMSDAPHELLFACACASKFEEVVREQQNDGREKKEECPKAPLVFWQTNGEILPVTRRVLQRVVSFQ